MDAIELAETGFVEFDGACGELDCVFWLEVGINLEEDVATIQS